MAGTSPAMTETIDAGVHHCFVVVIPGRRKAASPESIWPHALP
jgi:hypothetical protein